MPRSFFYDRDGEPITCDEWGARLGDIAYAHVAMAVIGDAEVSTVWLGISYTDPPLIYETMVFGGQFDQRQWRYPSLGAAVAGHDQVVAAIANVAAGTR